MSTSIPEDQRLIRHADVLGAHDLVSATILQDPVLMDAGLVRKGVPADDGLVHLHSLTPSEPPRCTELHASSEQGNCDGTVIRQARNLEQHRGLRTHTE